MLTPGVSLGDVPLEPSSHMTIRWWFTRKTKWNKWGFSISSCRPQNHALLSIIGISADILVSWTSSLWMLVEGFLGKTSCSHRRLIQHARRLQYHPKKIESKKFGIPFTGVFGASSKFATCSEGDNSTMLRIESGKAGPDWERTIVDWGLQRRLRKHWCS
jgi:hypothetical protein